MTSVGARLQLIDLTVTYEGAVTAVDRLNLDVQPGEFVTLLGPSGSGKTSVLMAIAGFAEPSSGQILVDGSDLLASPPNQRNLGMVFQDYALFPHMTVGQNIGFPLKMRQWTPEAIKDAVEGALRMVRLPGHESRYPRQLSGGEQQRVALARATVFQPPVLLMDEPLGALDKQLREYLQQELKRIQRDTGITTLYVTHDQAEALVLSDRIAVMCAGRVEQVGTPAELYEEPANRFVAEFVGETNFISGHLTLSDKAPLLETYGGWRLPLMDSDRREGEPVEVAIRPERVLIGYTDGEITATGKVVEVIYGGEMIRARIELSGGEVLTIKQQNRGRGPRLDTGESVTVGWDVRDMSLMQAERASQPASLGQVDRP